MLKLRLFVVIFLMSFLSLALVEQSFSAGNVLKIATCATGGGYYIQGASIASIINKYIKGYTANAFPTACQIENIRMMAMGKADIALQATSAAYYSYRGLLQKPWVPNPKLRTIYTGGESYLNIVTMDNSGIKSISDIKGKKVGLAPGGSQAYEVFIQLLKFYGISTEDIKSQILSVSEQVDALKDGVIDVFANIAGGRNSPASALIDLSHTHKVYWIPIDDDKMNEILKVAPYYVARKLPPGFYKGITKPTLTEGYPNGLYVSEDMDEMLAYQITKTIWEHKDELEKMYNMWKSIDISEAATNSVTPLHPGAERYYKEMKIPISQIP